MNNLEEIAKVAIENDLYIIQDAVYKQLIYDDMEYVNIARISGMKERTVYLDSLSKSHSMTGWRVGYICGSKEIVGKMPKLQENIVSCVTSFVQDAATETIRDQRRSDEAVQSMREQYEERRNIFTKGIQKINKLSVVVPRGAFYLFVNIKNTNLTSEEFCIRLLEEHNVLISPGSAFGKMGEGYVRLSYATSVENIEEGIKRIKKFVETL